MLLAANQNQNDTTNDYCYNNEMNSMTPCAYPKKYKIKWMFAMSATKL